MNVKPISPGSMEDTLTLVFREFATGKHLSKYTREAIYRRQSAWSGNPHRVTGLAASVIPQNDMGNGDKRP